MDPGRLVAGGKPRATRVVTRGPVLTMFGRIRVRLEIFIGLKGNLLFLMIFEAGAKEVEEEAAV